MLYVAAPVAAVKHTQAPAGVLQILRLYRQSSQHNQRCWLPSPLSLSASPARGSPSQLLARMPVLDSLSLADLPLAWLHRFSTFLTAEAAARLRSTCGLLQKVGPCRCCCCCCCMLALLVWLRCDPWSSSDGQLWLHQRMCAQHSCSSIQGHTQHTQQAADSPACCVCCACRWLMPPGSLLKCLCPHIGAACPSPLSRSRRSCLPTSLGRRSGCRHQKPGPTA